MAIIIRKMKEDTVYISLIDEESVFDFSLYETIEKFIVVNTQLYRISDNQIKYLLLQIVFILTNNIK